MQRRVQHQGQAMELGQVRILGRLAATLQRRHRAAERRQIGRIVNREIYETMTGEEQGLFDELQNEIEELRRMLANRDQKGLSKVELICVKLLSLQTKIFNTFNCHKATSRLSFRHKFCVDEVVSRDGR